MMKEKSKAYKFLIIMSSLCIILTVVNYMAFKVPDIDEAFIVGLMAFVIIIICFNIEN